MTSGFFHNEWIFYSSTHIQYSKNSKEQNCVDWTERLKEHLSPTTALKDTLMKKHTELKQNIKNMRMRWLRSA